MTEQRPHSTSHSRPGSRVHSRRESTAESAADDAAPPASTPAPRLPQTQSASSGAQGHAVGSRPRARVSTVGLSLSLEPSTMAGIEQLRACDFRLYDPRRPDPFRDLQVDPATDSDSDSEGGHLPAEEKEPYPQEASFGSIPQPELAAVAGAGAGSVPEISPQGSAEEIGRQGSRPPRIRALNQSSSEALHQASTDSLASSAAGPVEEQFPPGDDPRAAFFRIFQNHRKESTSQLPRNPTSRHVFLQSTDANFLLPLPSVVPRDEHGGRIRLSHFGLGSRYGVAVADSIKVHPTAAVLEMRANRLTSGPAIALAHTIRVNAHITSLDLSANRIGREGGVAVADCLRGACSLTHLDLGGNKLGDGVCREVCQALIGNDSVLSLSLADNDMAHLGAAELAKVLMANKTLRELDISWNHLHGARAVLFGKALAHNGTLEELRMAWNGLGDDGGIEIAQGLRANTGLVTVDLSANGLTERPCIVLGAALNENKTLKEVRLGMNPVGQKGGRALVRAMSNAWRRRTAEEADAEEPEEEEEAPVPAGMAAQAERKIDLARCNFECTTETGTNRYFDFSEPSGRYSLDVGRPYDRVVAMELMRLALDEGAECWKNARFNGRPFPLPEPHALAYALPDAGTLEVEYVHLRVQADGLGYLSKRAFEVFTRSVQGDAKGLAALTKIASHDVYFTTQQIAGVLARIGDSTLRVQAMAHVFSRILDFENLHGLVVSMPEHEARAVRHLIGQLYYFNPRNPTGHYKLSLENPFDRRIALQLQEMGNKEKLVRKNFADTSRDGRRETWRNEALNGYPFQYKPSYEIPQNGVLELDYVCTAPVPTTARPMADEAFEKLLEQELRLGKGIVASLLGVQPIDELGLASAPSGGPLKTAGSGGSKGAPAAKARKPPPGAVDLEAVKEGLESKARAPRSNSMLQRSGSMERGGGGERPAPPRSGSLVPSPKSPSLGNTAPSSRRSSLNAASTVGPTHNVAAFAPPPPAQPLMAGDVTSPRPPLGTHRGSIKRAGSIKRTGSMRRREVLEAGSRLRILRLRTVQEYYSCAQVRRVAESFTDHAHRVEAAVTLFARTTDPEFYWTDVVQATLDREHLRRCMNRLGWLNVWNPVFAEGFYELDLSVREDRVVCECLVALAVAEPGENWIGETMNGQAFELPASWIKEVPKKGLLTLTYRVSEASVQIDARYAWVAKTLLGSLERLSVEQMADKRRALRAAAKAAAGAGAPASKESIAKAAPGATPAASAPASKESIAAGAAT
eukprot:tig00000204_g17729.t1